MRMIELFLLLYRYQGAAARILEHLFGQGDAVNDVGRLRNHGDEQSPIEPLGSVNDMATLFSRASSRDAFVCDTTLRTP